MLPRSPPSPVASARCARLARLVAGLLLAMLAALLPAMAAPVGSGVLVLTPERPDVDAWPATTVLADPGGTLGIDEVLRRRAEFAAPAGRPGNLGMRDGAVWLRLRVLLPLHDDGRWLLEIDYPPLDRVDAYVVAAGGLIVAQRRLGDGVAFAERPLPTRSHAMRLPVERGVEHEVLLRVQSRSAMLVPLRLVKPAAFQARDARLQMLQGLAAGINVCLVAYALLRAAARREKVYLHYALSTAGSGLFLFSLFGLGAQHLWPGSAAVADLAPMVSVLVGLAGALWLIEGLLPGGGPPPPLARLTRLAGGAAAACALLLAVGLLDYRIAHPIASVLGPFSMLAALPMAWAAWRAGDRAALGIFLGWGACALGATVLSLLLHGWLADTTWTRHAYQIGALLQALAWLRVLDLHDAEQHQRAERAERERLRLQALADSDALTGLPNRRGLERALEAGIASARADDPLALYLIDLDGFKEVNDALGHEAGDRLLVAVARRLRATLRQDDFVARLGGDEFVVLARRLRDGPAATQFGQRLVRAFDEPFDLGDGGCRIGLTIGLVVAPEDGRDASTLLRGADAAMYAGKRGGKHTLRRVAATA